MSPRTDAPDPPAVRESRGATSSFDLSDHSLCFAARDGTTSQGHIVVDLDHRAATTEQQHRARLRVARHAEDPSVWRIARGTGQGRHGALGRKSSRR
jgi:hypothetical protein